MRTIDETKIKSVIIKITNLLEDLEEGSNPDNYIEDEVFKVKYSDDSIMDKLLHLLEGFIGEEPSREEIDSREKAAISRKKSSTPPGYKDNKKDDGGLGDCLIWFEIIDYAKKNNKNVILISDDKKEDWWWIMSGKTVGPRWELRKEFSQETEGNIFYMYNLTQFLTIYSDRVEEEEDFKNEVDKIIDEIEELEEAEIRTQKLLANGYDKLIDSARNIIPQKAKDIYFGNNIVSNAMRNRGIRAFSSQLRANDPNFVRTLMYMKNQIFLWSDIIGMVYLDKTNDQLYRVDGVENEYPDTIVFVHSYQDNLTYYFEPQEFWDRCLDNKIEVIN